MGVYFLIFTNNDLVIFSEETPLGKTYQELLIRDTAVTVLVSEVEHLTDLGLGDVLWQVRHHLPEVREAE